MTEIETIQRIVAEFFRVTLAQLVGDERTTEMALARHVAVALCRQLTRETLVTISAAFGYAAGHGHGSACHAVSAVQSRCETDVKFAAVFEMLKAACKEAIAPEFDAASLVRMLRLKNRKKFGDQRGLADGTGPSERKCRKRDDARKECDAAMKAGNCTRAQILREEYLEALCESDPEKLVAELLDVAAVSLDWVDDILARQVPAANEVKKSETA